jgi:hypothetical protein
LVAKDPLNNAGISFLKRFLKLTNPHRLVGKWTEAENQKLFSLYKIHRNSWKEISKNISGRTDKSIKNQFFALLRKGLRKACKSIGMTHNTMKINTIKPKMLLDFFDSPFKVDPVLPYNSMAEFIEYHAMNYSIKSNMDDPLVCNVIKEMIEVLKYQK